MDGHVPAYIDEWGQDAAAWASRDGGAVDEELSDLPDLDEDDLSAYQGTSASPACFGGSPPRVLIVKPTCVPGFGAGRGGRSAGRGASSGTKSFASPTKQAAWERAQRLSRSPQQSEAAYRHIRRATNSEQLAVRSRQNVLIIEKRRPGAVEGHQVITTRISPKGRTTTIQRAYDSKGRLIHRDPKGGR